MTQATSTVAVNAPLKGMPVPGDDRIVGLTTTTYAMVKKVVMSPMMSARSATAWGWAFEDVVIGNQGACYHPST